MDAPKRIPLSPFRHRKPVKKQIIVPKKIKKSPMQVAVQYVVITLGTLLLGFGIAVFFAPAKFTPGGLSSVSIILEHFFPRLSLGLIYIITVVPVFILGIFTTGLTFGVRSIYATILLSVSLTVFQKVFGHVPELHDYFLISVFGALCVGVGVGALVRNSATTGGTDMLGAILHKLVPSIPMSIAMVSFDSTIIIIGVLVFRKINVGLYSLTCAYITSRFADFMIVGLSKAKAVSIVTDKKEEIRALVLQELKNGATLYTTEGAYSGQRRYVFLCITPPRKVPRLTRLVGIMDPKAFVFVSQINEVLNSVPSAEVRQEGIIEDSSGGASS